MDTVMEKHIRLNLGEDGIRMAQALGVAFGWRLPPPQDALAPDFPELFCVCTLCRKNWAMAVSPDMKEDVRALIYLTERFTWDISEECPHLDAVTGGRVAERRSQDAEAAAYREKLERWIEGLACAEEKL